MLAVAHLPRFGPDYLSSIQPQEPASVSAPKLTDKPAETLPVQRILKEVSRRIVGQDAMVERLLVGLLTGGHILLEGVPGLGQDPRRAHAGRDHPRLVLPHPVHARSPAGRRDRHDGLRPEVAGLPRQEGAALRPDHPGRRDQPRPGQGAGGAARGDAGAPGHHRRHHLSARGAVHGPRHAESDRERGHLSAARGAARSLHAQGAGGLSQRATRRRKSCSG